MIEWLIKIFSQDSPREHKIHPTDSIVGAIVESIDSGEGWEIILGGGFNENGVNLRKNNISIRYIYHWDVALFIGSERLDISRSGGEKLCSAATRYVSLAKRRKDEKLIESARETLGLPNPDAIMTEQDFELGMR